MISPSSIDYNDKHYYILRDIEYSNLQRIDYRNLCFRVMNALNGDPLENLYEKSVKNALKTVDQQFKQEAQAICSSVPSGYTRILGELTDFAISQLTSGVDQFKFEVLFNAHISNEKLDLMNSTIRGVYRKYNMEALGEAIGADQERYGMGASFTWWGEHGLELRQIAPQDVLMSTNIYSSERKPIGITEMISYKDLRKFIEDEGLHQEIELPGGRKIMGIKTLNNMDIPIDDLNDLPYCPYIKPFGKYMQRKYTVSPVKYTLEECWGEIVSSRGFVDINHELTPTTSAETRSKSNFDGADVERTYYWDDKKKDLYVVINRMYVLKKLELVPSKKHERELTDAEKKEREEIFEHLEHFNPIDIAPYMLKREYVYPYTPVFGCLEYFDRYYAYNSMYNHNTYILSLLTFVSSASNRKELQKMMLGSGAVLDDIDGDIQILQKPQDMSALLNHLARLEQKMQDALSSYPATAITAMQKDRGTAAADGQLQETVSMGLSMPNKHLEMWASSLIYKALCLSIAFKKDLIQNKDMVLGYEDEAFSKILKSRRIEVVSKARAKVMNRIKAANVMALVPVLTQNPYIDQEKFLVDAIRIATYGDMDAANYIKKPELPPAQIQTNQQAGANVARAYTDEQELATTRPFDYAVSRTDMSSLPPNEQAEIAAMGSMIAEQGAGTANTSGLVMPPNSISAVPEVAGIQANEVI